MTDTRWVWPAIIVLSAALIGVLVFLNVESPVRPVLAIWFLIVCPGMALVRLIGLQDRWTETTVAVALSMSLDIIVSLMLVYSGLWSPKLGLAILIGISVAGSALQMRPRTPISAEAVVGD